MTRSALDQHAVAVEACMDSADLDAMFDRAYVTDPAWRAFVDLELDNDIIDARTEAPGAADSQHHQPPGG